MGSSVLRIAILKSSVSLMLLPSTSYAVALHLPSTLLPPPFLNISQFPIAFHGESLSQQLTWSSMSESSTLKSAPNTLCQATFLLYLEQISFSELEKYLKLRARVSNTNFTYRWKLSTG